MPRLFTALEIPEDLARDLAELRGGLPGSRWIEPENYHITLRFVGDTDMATAREFAGMLDETRHSRSPVAVALEGLSVFGGSRPRALIAKVQSSVALVDLQREHEHIARRLGFAPETRKFVPHVTLARLRGASDRAMADYLGVRGSLNQRFTAERFVLFSSRASVGGGPYIAEEVYPFE